MRKSAYVDVCQLLNAVSHSFLCLHA